jgi:WhiB family transcriptional regulator, redox-sensing transcriptional regulator
MDVKPNQGDDWRDKAQCVDSDPSLFFPIGNKVSILKQIESAKAICRICVVQADCLEYALRNREENGIWGGMDEAERRQIQKNRRTGEQQAM